MFVTWAAANWFSFRLVQKMKDLNREQNDRPDVTPASCEENSSKDLDFREIFAQKSQFSHYDKECNKWTEPIIGVLRILEDVGQYWVNIKHYKNDTICANHLIKSGMKLLPKDSKQRSFTYWTKIKETDLKEECLQVKFENKEKASQFAEIFNQCCRKLNENVTIETSKEKFVESHEVNSKQKLLTKTKPDFESNVATFKMEFREDLNAKKSFYKCKDSDEDDETEIISEKKTINSQQDFQANLPKVKRNQIRTNSTESHTNKTYKEIDNINLTSAVLSTSEMAVTCKVFKTGDELGKLNVGDRVIFHATASSVTLIDNVDSSEDEQEPNQDEPASSATSSSLSEMFKPKAGSWECDGCLVRNNSDVVKCPACGTLKAGTKPEDVPKPAAGGISFGASLSAGPAVTQDARLGHYSDHFETKQWNWKCGDCMLKDNFGVMECFSCGTLMSTKDGFIFTTNETSMPTVHIGLGFGASSSQLLEPTSVDMPLIVPATNVLTDVGLKFDATVTSTAPTHGIGYPNDSSNNQKTANRKTTSAKEFSFGEITTECNGTAGTKSATKKQSTDLKSSIDPPQSLTTAMPSTFTVKLASTTTTNNVQSTTTEQPLKTTQSTTGHPTFTLTLTTSGQPTFTSTSTTSASTSTTSGRPTFTSTSTTSGQSTFTSTSTTSGPTFTSTSTTSGQPTFTSTST
ncbi:nuclear pore complex protein Nup153-like, partial [Physella acuta]|uniref:nuclear pore complex protein Nup153-like n=1 Tax=Physella acuta TaxID=109671 RepID=UPI0027DB0328